MRLVLILFLTGLLQLCSGAKILFLIPTSSRSHYVLGERLMEALVKKGHEVTVIAPTKKSNPMKNLEEIIVPDFSDAFFDSTLQNKTDSERFNMRGMSPLDFLMVSHLGEKIVNNTMSSEPVQKFLKSNQNFDLVIGECFLIESMIAGFAHKFKAPMAGISTFMPNTWANEMVGNPAPSSYIPEPILNFTNEMNFYERLVNFVYSTLAQVIHYVRHLPSQDKLMRKFFGDDLPPLKELITKTSLVLVNHHYSLGFPRPYLPNMVEVGSFHVKPPKPLPAALDQFITEAKHGVILFSLGSNLKSPEFPKEKFEELLKIFSKLKQRILWKFETTTVTNLPENVKILKWLPQADVLAHPNVKLFITHGKLLNIIESVHRGVPIVGVPIFGDQPMNMKLVEKLEFGLTLEDEEVGTDVMFQKINEVLTNPNYTKNAKLRSQLLQDVPMPHLDLAIYWIEYVIRHKGAPHLISGAQDLAWYQLHLIDVYLVFGAAILIFSFISVTCLKFVCRTLCSKKLSETVMSKKTN